MGALTPGQLASLAAAAIQAPSADNRHAFRLAADSDGVSLWATPEWINAPASRRILNLLSIGAVAENLSLRAGQLGLRTNPDWHWRLGDGSLIARFSLRDGADQADPLADAIEARHTNRRLRFAGPRLTVAEQVGLSAQAAKVPGTALVWLDEPARRQQALALIRQAETERFRNEALHRELFGAIRFDVGWRESVAQGLPPAALELPWFERPAFRLLRHWSVQRAANLVGVHRVIGFRAGDLPCRLAPHLCAVSAEGDAESASVNAGSLLQRVWLHATMLGMSFQVFAASTLYALDGSDSIAGDLRSRLAVGWRALSPWAVPYIVFRMGHAAKATCRAGRVTPRSVAGIVE